MKSKLDDSSDRPAIAGLLRSLNVRVCLNFKKATWGKRVVNKLESGMVCVGNVPDPVRVVVGNGAESGLLCMVNR